MSANATGSDATKPQPTVSLERRLMGSCFSAFIGWAAFNTVCVVGSLSRIGSFEWHDWWGGLLIMAMYSGGLVFVAWVFAFLPVYLFLPVRSVLWRWPNFTLCGGLAGAAIMYALSFLLDFSGVNAERIVASTIAAFVGSVTCLCASLTRRFFNQSDSG